MRGKRRPKREKNRLRHKESHYGKEGRRTKCSTSDCAVPIEIRAKNCVGGDEQPEGFPMRCGRTIAGRDRRFIHL